MEIYNLDGNTQLEFLSMKKIIIIDKDQFFDCKKMILESATDAELSEYLSIPEEKVKVFKSKMNFFEQSMLEKRRASIVERQLKRAAAKKPQKREISSEERFRRARELFAKNLGVNQISKILKVSERSVTRFKRRMREEKLRLKAEGKIELDPNDSDDENSFKHLTAENKLNKIKELFRRRLKIQKISQVLRISERSVRRWKDKLDKIETDAGETGASENVPEVSALKRSTRITKPKIQLNIDSETDLEDSKPAPKKRRLYVDKDKVQYATELIDNGMSNKEMSKLLDLTIACVRKLKLKILNGTADELIDNSEEHYSSLGKRKTNGDSDSDPLNVLDCYYASVPSTSTKPEARPKVVLSERDMYIARLLREHEIRTMDIAKLMEISERSVTRLIAKTKQMETLVYEADVVAEVERILANKDRILNPGEASGDATEEELKSGDNSKKQLGMNLLAMNVKVKDIAKMIGVNEKLVQQWKKSRSWQEVTIEEETVDDDDQIIEDDAGDRDDLVYEELEYEEYEQEVS